MKISIITVTKNNKDGLLRAIECVHNQTYKNVEHLIIDGGSTDGSVEAIKHEQPAPEADGLKIKNLVFISEPDNGIYDAINKGIRLAAGDIIGLLHSDDLYAHINVLSNIAEIFRSKSADAVYADLQYVDKKNPDKIFRNWIAGEFNRNSLKFGWMPPHPTLFIKRSLFDKYGFYDESFTIAADYEFVLRVFSQVDIKPVYLPEIIYKMKTGGQSNKSPVNIFNKSREDFKAIKKHRFTFPVGVLLCKNFRKIPQLF